MSVLKEMFGENNEDENIIQTEQILLAKGKYSSNAQTIIEGYSIFRKKYTLGSLIFRLVLVLLAILSSVFTVISNFKAGQQEIFPYFLILVAITIGIYFINVFNANMKHLKQGLDELEGEEYMAEIYNDSIKITSLSAVLVKETPDEHDINVQKEIEERLTEDKKETDDNEQTDDSSDEKETEEEPIPATIIHLNQSIVDILDKDNMFIIVVRKKYVFVIPKSAFSEEEIKAVQDKFKSIMGIRYKTV